MRTITLSVLFVSFALAVQAQSLDSLLRAIGASDQRVRDDYGRVMRMRPLVADSLTSVSSRMAAVDAANQRFVFSLLDEKGWPEEVGEQAHEAIWHVIQHAGTADQKRYMPVVEEQARKGRVSWADYAASLDRMLKHEGLPQRYGTQVEMRVTDGEVTLSCLWPVEDAARLDSLRASVGLPPIADYLRMVEEHVGVPVEWDPEKTVSQLR